MPGWVIFTVLVLHSDASSNGRSGPTVHDIACNLINYNLSSISYGGNVNGDCIMIKDEEKITR